MSKSELKNIKKNNFLGYLSQLKTVKENYLICKQAVLEYNSECQNNIIAQKEWLNKHIDLGILFEDIFDFGIYFHSLKSAENDNLELMDSSVIGFRIIADREDFEYEIKFKIIFQRLFFEEKLCITELEKYKNDLDSNFPF